MEENEIEKEERGMSVGDFFRVVFSQKWIALIILVVVTLAGTLGIYFGVNSLNGSYDVTFTLELPRSEIKEVKQDDQNQKTQNSSVTIVYYPDGTPFYYSDIVSIQTLRKIKYSEENKEKFRDINVETMSTKGDISIARKVSETANNSGEFEVTYNLSVKSKYFPNADVARSFIETLTKTPIDYLGLMDINYNVYIDSARSAPDYPTEISQLISQINYIIERYEDFVKIYNDLSVDGKTLRLYAQELRAYLNDSGQLELLLAEARRNGYLKSESLKEKYDTELYMLERQYNIANNTLKNLLTIKDGSDSLSASSAAIIKEQSDLVAELEEEIREIKEIYQTSELYGDNVPSAFKEELAEEYRRVEKYTDEFKEIVAKLYSKVSVVSYSNSNVIVKSGTTGIVLSLILSFVVGLVLAILVAFIVGWLKNRKNAVSPVSADNPAESKKKE